jgi:hypothetical protein
MRREFYVHTLKYFHLAIVEFLPVLEELKNSTQDKATKEEIEDLIEAYKDIDAKIDSHHLNYEDPNRCYDGEPNDIYLDLPDEMTENLSRLSHRLLLTWKDKQDRLQKKKYLTDSNKDEIRKLENLIWPLEALTKEGSYVLGKYRDLGPLTFPGERNDSALETLLKDIHHCYELGDQDLLETKKLEEVEAKARTEVPKIIAGLNNEILDLKVKKINSGWRSILKSGFHNRKTAESKLGAWETLINEMLGNGGSEEPETLAQTPAEVVKTIKSRLKTEDLFVESRSQGEDQHLLIGKRDGTAEKAHLVVDGKTGEIRVEDNQQEPTDLIQKIESILTLKSGKKIRTTRESVEEMASSSEQRPRIDLTHNFTVSGSGEGNFIEFQVKNDGATAALDIQAELIADGDIATGKIDITHSLSPQKESGNIRYRYTDTDFFQKKLDNPCIVFTYRTANGQNFSSGRKLIQDTRADGRFNIHSRPGEYFEN